MSNNRDKTNKSEEESNRRLSQKVRMEKLKTPKKDIKNLKTLEDLQKENR